MRKRIILLFVFSVFLCSCNMHRNSVDSKLENQTCVIIENEPTTESFTELSSPDITPSTVSVGSLVMKEGEIIDLPTIGLNHVTILKKVESRLVTYENKLSQIFIIGDYRYTQEMYHDLYLAIENGGNMLVYNLQSSSFEDSLYSCDVDGDGFDEIIIHQAVDSFGGSGQFVSRVFKVINEQLLEIFNSQVVDSLNCMSIYDTGFEGNFKEEKKFEITNRFTGYYTVFDISKKYQSDFFDENGIGAYGSLVCDSFFEFNPKDTDNDGIFEIECLQCASITSRVDFAGYAKSVLKYNKETQTFDVIQSEFIPPTDDLKIDMQS